MNQLTNETLLRLTANMPMKQINLTHMGTAIDEPKNSFNSQYLGSDLYSWECAYLQRYYAGTFRDGSDLWLHRFLSGDGDRYVHSHPFEFDTVMLCGGYTEEFITKDGGKDHRVSLPNPKSQLPELLEEFLIKLSGNFPPSSYVFLSLSHGANQSLDVYDWHRIASVQPETWTAVIVKPKRLPKWFFKDDDGDLIDMKASEREWWENYKVRPGSGIALDDNHV